MSNQLMVTIQAVLLMICALMLLGTAKRLFDLYRRMVKDSLELGILIAKMKDAGRCGITLDEKSSVAPMDGKNS